MNVTMMILNVFEIPQQYPNWAKISARHSPPNTLKRGPIANQLESYYCSLWTYLGTVLGSSR